MKISIANNRQSKKWTNKEISWEELISKLSSTQRTVETIEEFLKMKKADQDDIKDVGGYVMGHLKQGLRRAGYVLSRSCITLDMDYAIAGIENYIRSVIRYKGCSYGTHKYTQTNPRLRIILSMSRDVTEEEYEPIARMIARQIGMDYFDDSTYEANRMMFWLSTPANVSYYFDSWDGDTVNPDTILKMYDNWRDITTWPTSSRQSAVIKRNASRQADPLSKKGIVSCILQDI